MEPIDPNEVYGDRFDENPNVDPNIYFDDEEQTIHTVIRTWGNYKLFDDEEHIENSAENFKRKLVGK